MTVENISENVI